MSRKMWKQFETNFQTLNFRGVKHNLNQGVMQTPGRLG